MSAADPPREIVSAAAIGKSGRVLFAFAHFYLPFYGHRPDDIFWHYDPFAWVSAFVYDVDDDIVSMKEDCRRNTFNIVCLAIRHTPDDGARFVEETRRKTEDVLLLHRESLSDTEREICTRILSCYRSIVRRPLLNGRESV